MVVYLFSEMVPLGKICLLRALLNCNGCLVRMGLLGFFDFSASNKDIL